MEKLVFPAHIRRDGAIQTVAQHCLETADEARRYLSPIGLGKAAYLAGLLHDAGKCTEEFRNYISAVCRGDKVTRGSVIHTFAGPQYLLNKFHCQTDEYSALTAEVLSIAIGSHHGLFDCFDEDSTCGFTHRLLKQPEYDHRALSAFFSEVENENELYKLFQDAKEEITQVVGVINNRAKSGEECFFFCSLLTRFITSAIVDADRSNTRNFEENRQDSAPKTDEQALWDSCLNYLNRYISTFPAKTQIQKCRHFFSEKCFEASKGECGLYRLNLPTGGGKTLSGLRFALGHAKSNNKCRIFFISPLLSILEQNADEIRKAIGNDSIVLEHHSDIVTEGKTQEEIESFELFCDSWNSPVVITTLVQFLNTLFSGKMSSVRRFHSLADSVIIIDEVQTVPPKMLSLFNSAVNFLTSVFKSTVVLCSATQPNLDCLSHPIASGKDIINQEDLKKYEAVFKRNQIEYKGSRRLSEIPELIAELFYKNTSVLAVCNKKSEAEELFHATESLCENCYHLSAGMCIAHRKAVLEAIKKDLKHGKKVLCISTQVIEAGVDISFSAVLRFAAGIDNIVQAAGRCNRNGEQQNKAPVWIVDCQDENLSHLKEIKDAKEATESLLYRYQNFPEQFDYDLSSDGAINFYYHVLYAKMPEKFFDYIVRHNTLYSFLSDNDQFAGSASKQEQARYIMRQAFKTAGECFEVFDSDQKSVIVPYREGEDIIAQLCAEGEFVSAETLDKAKPYTVSVFSYQFENLVESGAIHKICGKEIYTLDPSYYDENIGIISYKKGNTKCNTLIL